MTIPLLKPTSTPGPKVYIDVIGIAGGWLMRVTLPFFASYFMPDSKIFIVDGGTYKPEHRDHEQFTALGNKAETSVRDIKMNYPHLRVTAIPKYVDRFNSSNVIDVRDLIGEGHYVFLQVDNDKTKSIVDQHGQTLSNVTILSAGTEEDECHIQVFIRRDGKNLTPPFAEYCSYIANPKDRSPVDDLYNPTQCPTPYDHIAPQQRRPIYPLALMTGSLFLLDAFYTVWKLESEHRLNEFPFIQMFFDISAARCRIERRI
jgi:hypothetical protein